MEPLTRALTVARVRIDAGDLHRFDQLTPVVHVAVDGSAWVAHGREGTPTKEEAAFAVDFAIRSLLQLEEWIARNPRHLAAAEGSPKASPS